MIHLALRHRFVTTALLVVVGSAIAGVLAATLLPDGQTVSTPGTAAQIVNAPDGRPLEVVQQADVRVSFPPELSGLGSVGGLAVDSKGNFWIPVFTGGDSGHRLYRYNPADGKIDTFSLPDNPGSAISSAIAVSPTDQIVLGYGAIIAVLDPGTGGFKTYDLPSNSPNHVKFGADEGTYVTDMDVGPDNSAFVTRMNIAAVTVVDLGSGATSEIPVAGMSGALFEVAVSGESVFAANWSSSGGTRVVKLSGDAFVEVAAGSLLALAGAADRVYTLAADGTLVGHSGNSTTTATEKQIPEAIMGESLAVDRGSGAVWLAGEQSVLIRWDPKPGLTEAFQLPTYWVRGESMFCPPGADCKGSTMYTTVGGIAVAPNSDVYFSDSTMNRIGLIKAGQ